MTITQLASTTTLNSTEMCPCVDQTYIVKYIEKLDDKARNKNNTANVTIEMVIAEVEADKLAQ